MRLVWPVVPRPRPETHTPEVMENLARIEAIWSDCRARYGGPFLFGKNFGNADAMYAPVATRFHSYDIALDAACAAYRDHIFAWPDLQEWRAAALAEPEAIEELEVEF